MKFSEWRLEYLKCSYLNYGQNNSGSIKFCGKINRIFCCGHHDWLRRCCSLKDFLHEMRYYKHFIQFLTWLLIIQFILIISIVIFIVIKMKKLTPHILIHK
nr:uncharacterized protein LOC113798036 [Dermatophagoides pteronyssinus]